MPDNPTYRSRSVRTALVTGSVAAGTTAGLSLAFANSDLGLWMQLAVGACAALCGMGLSLWASRWSRATLYRPIELLAQQARQATLNPELQPRVDSTELRELALLCNYLNHSLDEIRDREESLQRVSAQSRNLLESLPVGIVDCDLRGRVTYANRAAHEQLDLDPGNYTGRAAWSFFADPTQAERLRQAFQRGQLQRICGMPVTYRCASTRGRAMFLEFTWSQRPPRRGEEASLSAVVLDVSERVAIQAERERLEAQLNNSQKLEAVGQLSGSFAHDFNNLLTAIVGFGELLENEIQHSPSALQHLAEIRRAANRAGNLTHQLLAFGRRQVLIPRLMDLNEVLNTMGDVLRRVLGKDINLEVIEEPRLWSVYVDPGQIQQVILNLAVNSRDAMPQGGTLCIETTNVELDEHYAAQQADLDPGAYVMLTVRDTGRGIRPEDQNRIFDPFFSTKPASVGTGLGLSAVYGILKQSHGYLNVFSEPGRGTTVNVFLPRVTAEVTTAPHATVPGKAHAHNKQSTILLVEDDEDVRQVTERSLRDQGHRVLVAEDAAGATRLFEEFRTELHLLITDVMLPQVAGPDLVDRLRRELPDLRVLFISGYPESLISPELLRQPATRFLHKPFSFANLEEEVRALLRENDLADGRS